MIVPRADVLKLAVHLALDQYGRALEPLDVDGVGAAGECADGERRAEAYGGEDHRRDRDEGDDRRSAQRLAETE